MSVLGYATEHPKFLPCSGPNWVPAQTMSLLTISQRAQVSLAFRNWDCGEEVAGTCGIRLWWSKSGASNWGLLTNLQIQTQFRYWSFLQLYQYQLRFLFPQKTLQKRLNTSHSMTTVCAYRRPHTSQRSIQHKLCGCRGTAVTRAHKGTSVAGQEEGSGHSFIALSCPTKYLLGEAQLLLPPRSDPQVTYHAVRLRSYHHQVRRRKHSS